MLKIALAVNRICFVFQKATVDRVEVPVVQHCAHLNHFFGGVEVLIPYFNRVLVIMGEIWLKLA